MVKRLLSVLVLVAATLFAVHASADEGKSNMDMKHMDMKKMNANAAPKATTLKGELVDMGCYLGHGAMGAKHQECATKCVANGMPMGLLTADGKLYLLTLNHDNGDAYNECKTLMAQTVELTGTVATKAGMKGIDVTGVKAVAAN